jgi:hypothetical protein
MLPALRLSAFATFTSDLDGRPAVRLDEGRIEPSQAAKAGKKSDLDHRQICAVEQPLCLLHTCGFGNLNGTSTEMLSEEPVQMARSYAKTSGKFFHAALIESASNDQT